MKRFNTTGLMISGQHYMVPIDRQVNAAAKMVEDGMYFTINRGRQYGKTTTLSFLQQLLSDKGYAVFSISFESLPDSAFESLETLLYASLVKMAFLLKWTTVKNLPESSAQLLREAVGNDKKQTSTDDYTQLIATLCSTTRVVLLVDEVDAAGNYPQFLKFLGLLREMYLMRNAVPAFQSVILAGVYDIKNLRLKMRPEDQHQYNSPWNIAAPFNVDMNLHADGIAEMLSDYMQEHAMQFDVQQVAQLIYDYTSGYPFLVSRLCQIIDESGYTWDKDGVLKAVNSLLKEGNTLFDDLTKKLNQFPSLAQMLQNMLYNGERVTYNYYDHDINLAAMFNYIVEKDGTTVVKCRLFETWLYNYFTSSGKDSDIYKDGEGDKNQFIRDGQLDMRHLIERFSVHFNEIYRPGHDDKFVESWGRKIFLTYLRPIINGVGNYYVEAETRNLTRSDLVVDYRGQQFVVELKIWRGNSYNERGEQQLKEYLEFFDVRQGYLVSFCFNKDKQPGIHDVVVGDKVICEAIV